MHLVSESLNELLSLTFKRGNDSIFSWVKEWESRTKPLPCAADLSAWRKMGMESGIKSLSFTFDDEEEKETADLFFWLPLGKTKTTCLFCFKTALRQKKKTISYTHNLYQEMLTARMNK